MHHQEDLSIPTQYVENIAATWEDRGQPTIGIAHFFDRQGFLNVSSCASSCVM
jgi:hypothetical protein